ncbi:hypothetical protein ABT336_26735 [Micromonospora sp. NPDC000207]|uniref:hypothetical protein n=1 Tax=Micromonospora sp. NPDC000207 TaxID=3154246 RepID=UPI0033341D41
MKPLDLAEISEPLQDQLSGLPIEGKAAFFGVCGGALLPLLREVERRFDRIWMFPEAEGALSIARSFAVGVAPARTNHELRERVLESVPNGHDMDSPWSTYAMDALVCIDAALVAASVDLQHLFKSSWLYYSLEPLVVTLSPIGYDIPPSLMTEGARLSLAVGFMSGLISKGCLATR